VAASFITRCLRDVFAFTPEGLEAAICDGWSMVDSLKSLSPEELRTLISAIPSMQLIMLALGRDPQSSYLYARELKQDFPLDDILVRISHVLPEHARVLASHREWLEAEKQRLFSLLPST
jgi:hypothetical protein